MTKQTKEAHLARALLGGGMPKQALLGSVAKGLALGGLGLGVGYLGSRLGEGASKQKGTAFANPKGPGSTPPFTGASLAGKLSPKSRETASNVIGSLADMGNMAMQAQRTYRGAQNLRKSMTPPSVGEMMLSGSKSVASSLGIPVPKLGSDKGASMKKEASGIEKLAKVLANSDINYETGEVTFKKEAVAPLALVAPGLGALYGASKAPEGDLGAQLRGALGGGLGTVGGGFAGSLGGLGLGGLGALGASALAHGLGKRELADALFAAGVPASLLAGALLGGLGGQVYGAQKGTQLALGDQLKQASAAKRMRKEPVTPLKKEAIGLEAILGGLWGARQAPEGDLSAQARGALGGGLGAELGSGLGALGGTLGGLSVGGLGGAALGGLGGAGLTGAALLAELLAGHGKPVALKEVLPLLLQGAGIGATGGGALGAGLGGLGGGLYGNVKGGIAGAQKGTEFALGDQMKQASATRLSPTAERAMKYIRK